MFMDEKKVGESPAEVTAKLAPWRQMLLDAANEIEVNGHCHGALSKAGALCFYGAINLVDRGSPWNNGRSPVADRAVYQFLKYLGSEPLFWNDCHSGTEVIAGMRACARQGI